MHPVKFSFQLILFIGFLCSISAQASDGETPDKRGIFKPGESMNLLENSSFEDGTSHWMLGKYNGGIGKFQVDTTNQVTDGRAAVVVTANDIQSSPSNVQLFSTVSLEKNGVYSIMFGAIVEKAELISVSFSSGNNMLFEEAILLNPGQQIYGPFNYRSVVDEQEAIFSFNLGKTNGKLYFDDVRVLEDKTENLFNEIIAKSGVNIHQLQGKNEVFIQLPTGAVEDFIVMVFGPGGRLVKTMKIQRGTQEASIDFSGLIQTGKYQVRVITQSNTLAYNIDIR